MGLDITAYQTAVITPEHPYDDEACYDAHHVRAFVYDGFEQSLAGLEGGRCYTVSGETFEFRAGSYHGYNHFRELLCRAALGVDVADVWDAPNQYRARPFFELLNFADNEGTLGPLACEELRRDFQQHGAAVRELAPTGLFDDFFAAKLTDWQRAVTLAAGAGLVRFH